MRAFSNPTMIKAMGKAHKEWRSMARLALQLRKGNNSLVWAEQQEKKFTGIFKRLLTDPIDEVERIAR